MRSGVWIMVAALAGCGGGYHHHQSYGCEVLEGPAELVLDGVLVERNGAETELALNAPVLSGDNLALSVSSSTPVYLYVVNLAPDGSREVVWPSDVPQVLDGSMRIPERSWFRLAGEAGPEVVALVASTDYIPLSRRGQRYLVELVQRESERTDLVKLQAAHPPGFFADGHATMGLRARDLRPTGGGYRLRTGAERVVLLLDLDHRPRG